MGFFKLLVTVSGIALSYLYVKSKSKKSRKSKVTLEFVDKEETKQDEIVVHNKCSGHCHNCNSCKSEPVTEVKEEPIITVTDYEPEDVNVATVMIEYEEEIIEDEDENLIEQMMREEEEAEECYGNCMNCSNFSKEDEEYVFGFCAFHNVEMLEDDGCFDFDSLR